MRHLPDCSKTRARVSKCLGVANFKSRNDGSRAFKDAWRGNSNGSLQQFTVSEVEDYTWNRKTSAFAAAFWNEIDPTARESQGVSYSIFGRSRADAVTLPGRAIAANTSELEAQAPPGSTCALYRDGWRPSCVRIIFVRGF
jgi:hypothetical protein